MNFKHLSVWWVWISIILRVRCFALVAIEIEYLFLCSWVIWISYYVVFKMYLIDSSNIWIFAISCFSWCFCFAFLFLEGQGFELKAWCLLAGFTTWATSPALCWFLPRVSYILVCLANFYCKIFIHLRTWSGNILLWGLSWTWVLPKGNFWRLLSASQLGHYPDLFGQNSPLRVQTMHRSQLVACESQGRVLPSA